MCYNQKNSITRLTSKPQTYNKIINYYKSEVVYMKTICFTGRRPKDLCGYTKGNYTNFIKQLTDIIASFINSDTTFITGGAQGFDQMAFWAIDIIIAQKLTQHNVKNIVYVPFRGQNRAWLTKGLFSQEEYNNMIGQATYVKYIHDELTDKHQIIKALYQRNHEMVDAADIVIALYPTDDWQTSKGGTAECMRYARSKNKKIVQLKYTINNDKLDIQNDNVVEL